jgi:hypothetical protein
MCGTRPGQTGHNYRPLDTDVMNLRMEIELLLDKQATGGVLQKLIAQTEPPEASESLIPIPLLTEEIKTGYEILGAPVTEAGRCLGLSHYRFAREFGADRFPIVQRFALLLIQYRIGQIVNIDFSRHCAFSQLQLFAK